MVQVDPWNDVLGMPHSFQTLLIFMQFALLLIIFMGGELFTGNTMYLTVGLLSGKVKAKQVALNLVVVYFSNWAGCVFTAYFFGYPLYISSIEYLFDTSKIPHRTVCRRTTAYQFTEPCGSQTRNGPLCYVLESNSSKLVSVCSYILQPDSGGCWWKGT